MFKGKAGSLQFLKDLHLTVPEWKVYHHKTIQGWGNPSLYQELELALKKKIKSEIHQKAHIFIDSLKHPPFDLQKKSYAVRSSASLEDSPDNSFAGIFETELEVTPAKILNAFKKVWLSLYDEKALSYCQDRGLSWSDLQMNIIIQEMIVGEKSGVLFQADPMGKIHQQVIVAGRGLGQGIVDDQVETDRYVIENKKIIQTTLIGDQILNQSEIDQLLEASAKIAANSPFFMDIEFTFLNDRLYVLQARPITNLPSKKSIHIFDNSNIAENYPGQSSPFTYTTLRRGYGANLKNLLRFLGLKQDDWNHLDNKLDHMVANWGGNIYYNLNNWYALFTVLPFGHDKVAKSFNEMVGISVDVLMKPPQRSIFQKLSIISKILPKFFSLYFFSKKHHQKYKQDFNSLYKDLQQQYERVRHGYELLDLLAQIDNRFLSVIKVPLFNDFFSGLINRACRLLAVKIADGEGEQMYNDLLSHKEDLESSKAIYSLIALSQIVQKNTHLQEYLKTNQNPLQSPSQDFNDKLKLHFDLYGDRSQWEMKIEVPTARENPETTVRLLLEYAQTGLSSGDQRKKEKEKFEAAKSQLRSYYFKKPLSTLLFTVLFKKCTEAICFREDARFDRVRFKGLIRKSVLKLGDVLVTKKYLTLKEDVFYLSYDEIMSLSQDQYGIHYYKELIDLRKKYQASHSKVSLPDRIVINDFTESLRFNQEVELSHSKAIKGLPCSGGLIEAYCEVVTDLSLAPSLKDKILIADRTDPAWGYFFVGVKGIIIEKGSMLSHAAIISRELGIPCIINVKNATQKFSSGMKLRMNGDSGEIEIL